MLARILLLSAWTALGQANAIPRPAPPPGGRPAKYTADSPIFRTCGSNCLYTACRLLGINVDLERVETLLRPDAQGMNTLTEVATAAERLGVMPVMVKLKPNQLSRVHAPALLHVKMLEGQQTGNHYIVYLGRSTEGIVYIDPPRFPAETPARHFFQTWTGHALLLFRTREEADAFRSTIARESRTWLGEPLLWTGSILTVLVMSLVIPRTRVPLAVGEGISS